MALDPDKVEKILDKAEDIADQAPTQGTATGQTIDTVLEYVRDELQELVIDSRPPRLYVFGRSGAGKSSLINALAKKEVAEVDSVRPTTAESTMYHVEFEDRHASWDVIDSRGLFESISPDGDIPQDTVELVEQDIKEYKPDILIHVMTPDQFRSGQDDFKTVEQLRSEIGSTFPPIIYCLNKVDTLAEMHEWPPEDYPIVTSEIKDNLDFVSDDLLDVDATTFENHDPLYGYEFDSTKHIGIVPTYLMPDNEVKQWNVGTLSWLIGDFLPEGAQLQFMQAQRRERLMKDLSRRMTNRFSFLAGGVGAFPAPVADIGVLLSLQAVLIALIGSFSCRELEWAAVQDYMGATGGMAAMGIAARQIARSLSQLVPIAGTTVSAAVAFGGTWAIGRSAEEYFFNDKVVKPSEIMEEGKQKFRTMT
mgnify:CR=1 FL=1